MNPNPDDVHYVIGGRLSKMDGDMHRLSIEERVVVSKTYVRRNLLIVSLQLFAQHDMPAFQVVVGEL